MRSIICDYFYFLIRPIVVQMSAVSFYEVHIFIGFGVVFVRLNESVGRPAWKYNQSKESENNKEAEPLDTIATEGA